MNGELEPGDVLVRASTPDGRRHEWVTKKDGSHVAREPVRYVVGFLFSQGHVLLLKKAKPEWQRGLLNGIGGKVEKGETFKDAMEREFAEEAGVSGLHWEMFVLYVGREDAAKRGALGGEGQPFEIAFFRAEVKDMPIVFGTPEEPIDWRRVSAIQFYATKALPNLQWLIPMAFYARRDDWPFEIVERRAM